MPSFPSGVPAVMVPFQFLRHNQLFQYSSVIVSGSLFHAGNNFLHHKRQLIVKIGDKLIDGSIVRQLKALEQALVRSEAKIGVTS